MKQSIQKHNISNMSPLAPVIQGEDCQHGMTIEHVWENAKCQNTELPRPRCWQWAWIENLMQRQHFQARSLNTAKMTHDKFIVKKRKHTSTIETVNTARLHDQWNGRLSTWLLKASLAYEKSAARLKNAKTKKKHTFDFNIQYFWSRAQEIPKMSFGNLKAGIFEPSWRPRNVKE